jgi:hypothetical protein
MDCSALQDQKIRERQNTKILTVKTYNTLLKKINSDKLCGK